MERRTPHEFRLVFDALEEECRFLTRLTPKGEEITEVYEVGDSKFGEAAKQIWKEFLGFSPEEKEETGLEFAHTCWICNCHFGPQSTPYDFGVIFEDEEGVEIKTIEPIHLCYDHSTLINSDGGLIFRLDPCE